MKYREHTEEIHGKYKGNAVKYRGKQWIYREHTEEIHGKYKVNTG